MMMIRIQMHILRAMNSLGMALSNYFFFGEVTN
jgi:hypothetical protein